MSGDQGSTTPGWGQPPNSPPPGWGQPPNSPSPGWGPPPNSPSPGWGPPPNSSPQGWGPSPGWGQQPGWGPPTEPPALRPGIVPLRPLGVGEILDGALQAIRRNPRAMLGLPAIVAGVYLVLILGFRLIPTLGMSRLNSLSADDGSGTTSFDKLDVAGLVGAAIGVGVGLLVLGILAGLAVTATQSCLIWLVAEATLGRRRTAGDAWRAVRDRLPRLIGLAVVQAVALGLVYVVVGGATAALIVAAAFGLHGVARVIVIVAVALVGLIALVFVVGLVYVRWVLAPAVLVLADQFPVPTGQPRPGVFDALRGSWNLVRRSTWRVFGITFLVTLIAQVVSSIISVPTSLVGVVVSIGGGASGHGLAGTLGSGVISALGSVAGLMLALPFTVGGLTLVYLDQRMRREGLDISIGLRAPTR